MGKKKLDSGEQAELKAKLIGRRTERVGNAALKGKKTQTFDKPTFEEAEALRAEFGG
ncbi:hypothetical protein [Streptomyces smyrnaeus]|uniref:hypothetical protein n=1 Tax=Streptomyces smyrnaeus TaxID=1387713 RepID=UPI0033FA3DEC